jgi:hypothetical protein
MIEVVSDVVASLNPIRREMLAKTASPASTDLSMSSCLLHMSFVRTPSAAITIGASVLLNVVIDKVLIQKIFGGAIVALELFWSFLICFLVSLPVGLFHKRLFANRAEVLLYCVCTPSPLCAGYASRVIVLFWRRYSWCIASPRRPWRWYIDRAWCV